MFFAIFSPLLLWAYTAAGGIARSEAVFWDALGWMHYKSGNFDRAIEHLNKAVALTPQAPLLRYHAGMAYFRKGDGEKARENLQKAIEADVHFHGIDTARGILVLLTD